MYLKTIAGALFLIVLSFFICQKIEAKRAMPREVEPVIYEGVKYCTGKKGYVEAWNIEKNEMLWEKEVYTIEKDPALESDVQDVFITSLNIENKKLIVVNEKGNSYEIELASIEGNKEEPATEDIQEEVTEEVPANPEKEDIPWYKNKFYLIIIGIVLITIPVDILIIYMAKKRS